jgi:hypothetical protein
LKSLDVMPDGRTGLFSLPDSLLESSSLDSLGSSLDSLRSLLYSTLHWSFLLLTLFGVSFARPSTGVYITWPSLDSLMLLAWVSLSLSYFPVWVSCLCVQAVSCLSSVVSGSRLLWFPLMFQPPLLLAHTVKRTIIHCSSTEIWWFLTLPSCDLASLSSVCRMWHCCQIFIWASDGVTYGR